MNLAIPHIVRNHNMQLALERGFPLLRRGVPTDRTLTIVGFGASLLTTWREIDPRKPKYQFHVPGLDVMSLSGARDFLQRHGMVPEFHADCDPRIHKAEFVRHRDPYPFTKYLMASCCHPQTWEFLKDEAVWLWHKMNGPETREWLNDRFPYGPNGVRIDGSSIGIAALGLAKALGYRKARLFGFDSCYDDEGRLRAEEGPYPYTGERPQTIEAGGVTYVTTENMLRQAQEFEAAADGLDCEIVGEGLLKAMINSKRAKEIA